MYVRPKESFLKIYIHVMFKRFLDDYETYEIPKVDSLTNNERGLRSLILLK